MVEIVWKRGAEDDLLGIFADLEDAREGAGESFTRMLDGTLQNLRNHPRMESRGIIVHALIHLSQNPETIRAKIRRLLGLR